MTDRRYGINKYGDGKLYGPSDSRLALAWDVSVDWDGDYYLESNEATRLVGASISRGRKRLLQPNGQGFEKIATGKATVTLLNRDGRFDGWNAASPLYPNVDGGKEIRIRVRDLNSGIIYPLFRGTITNINPTGSGRDAKVTISASDGLDYVRNNAARVAMQLGITPDAAIGKVLDAIQWPNRWGRNLDVSTETIPYWWASSSKKAMSEIEDLAQSFLGYFSITADGQARFVHRTSIASAVMSYDQSQLLKEIGNPQPWEIRRNITRLKVHPRTQAATGTIWQLIGNTPSVLNGAANAFTIFTPYTYNNAPVPAINVITPVATTDWKVNSLSTGLGTDLTGSCTLAFTDFGDSAKVVITNNSGSTGYITLLQIRGDAIYEVNSADITYPKDVDTVSNPRELIFDLQWQQDLNVGRDLADVLGPFYAGLNPIPFISIDNRPELQYTPDLFDIVDISIEKLGLSGYSFRVGGIEHKTDPAIENCQRVISTLYLEPYIAGGNYMHWDTQATWDSTTIFGY